MVIYTPHAFFYLGLKGWARAGFLGAEYLLRPFTDVLLATSPSEARRAISDVKFPSPKVKWVSNAVRVPETYKKIAGEDTTFSIVFVGRICYQKNVELFLDVVACFNGDSSVKFTLIGPGHYPEDRKALNRLMHSRSIDPRKIEVLDWMPREQLLPHFAVADVCMLTSRYESFGYVVAEANAMETPAVATSVDGVCDIVEDGVTGILIGSNRAEDFADALRHLRDAPATRRRMGVEARKRVKSLFNIERNSKLLAEFYEYSSR